MVVQKQEFCHYILLGLLNLLKTLVPPFIPNHWAWC